MGRLDRLELDHFKSYAGKQTIGPFDNFTCIIELCYGIPSYHSYILGIPLAITDFLSSFYLSSRIDAYVDSLLSWLRNIYDIYFFSIFVFHELTRVI